MGLDAVAVDIAETCRNAVLSLDTFGTCIQIGLTTEEERGIVGFPIDLITGQELEFIGSKGMQPSRYDELVELVETGRLDPTKVISQTVALGDTPDVLEAMTNYENDGISVITEF